MGRPIVYCGDCGLSLREQDFEKGRAHEIDRQPFCSECRPPSLRPRDPEPPRISTAHIPRVGTTRRRASRRSSRAPLAAAGGLLALIVLAVVVASSPSPAPPSAPERAPAAARAVEPSPPSRLPDPPPTAARPAPPSDEPLAVEAPVPDPRMAVDRWLEDVRTIRARDPEFRRAEEVRTLLRKTAEIAGPRRAEVEALRADYEKAAAGPLPGPAPAPAPAAAPPAPRPAGPRISATYTLIDAETGKPVPGYDPMPADAVVDVDRLGLRKIDVRINLTGKVGSLATVRNGGNPHVENGPPWSFTNNSVADGYSGWVPQPGPQALQVTPYSEKGGKGVAGEPLSFGFTIAKRDSSSK